MNALVNLSQLAKTYRGPNKLKFDNRVKNWLPLYPSPELAGLVADLMADGHLQGPPKWRFDYCSKSSEELHRFEKVLYSSFRMKGKVRDCTTNNYGTKNYGVNCRPLAKILFLVGVPHGNKVVKRYLIPRWVLEDKECFTYFVRRYFDCEGCVDLSRNELKIELYKSTEFVENALLFLNQMKHGLFQYFEINTMRPFLLSNKIKRKHGAVVQGARLKISRKSNLQKFYENINFDTPYKRKALELAIA